MRVLQINSVCKSGSTGKIAYDLHAMLLKDGHQSLICYGRGPKLDLPGVIKFGNNFGFLMHVLLTRITGFTGMFSNHSTNKLIKLMEEFKPQIVHLHNLHGYYVNMYRVIEYLKKKRINTIWTLHDEHVYTGKCGYAFSCEKWQTECGKCPQIREYPSSLLFDCTSHMFRKKKSALLKFDKLTIVTPSKWLADRVGISFLHNKHTIVIHNGVDTENVFYPHSFEDLKAKHKLTNEKIVLAVAPDIMRTIKGGRHVLEVARCMKKDNVKFILIGVKDLSESFDSNVIAIGRTEDQHELAKYYSMADVFLLCSVKETFSMTCAEALACGAPVVGLKSGAPESVFQEPEAVFIELYDNDRIVEKIRSIFVNNHLSRKVIQYSSEKMYSAYLCLYRSSELKQEAN